jgi:hypothetical protein
MKSKELRKSHIIFHLKGTSISLGRWFTGTDVHECKCLKTIPTNACHR